MSKVDNELERHNKVLEKIRNATKKEELPSITVAHITKFLANNVCIDNVHISQTEFKPVVDAILAYSFFLMPEVKQVFMDVLRKNYPGKSEEEYLSQYDKIAKTPNISNYMQEAGERNLKFQQLKEEEELQEHEKIMEQIGETFEIKDLPKVSKGVLNRRIQSATKSDVLDKWPIDKINVLADLFLEGKSEDEIYEELYSICEELCEREEAEDMFSQISFQMYNDKVIGYIAEEVNAKEKRILEIYKLDHEETMENIRNAKRISQLPPNLTFSTLAGYLSGNTTIYPKGEKISTTDLKDLTELLLKTQDFNSSIVLEELKKVAQKQYPENSQEAYELLLTKLSSLPRTQYLIEEINLSQKRQEEFIGKNCSNVNVYFVPNNNSPIEGGRFYNCYINRVDNLDLGQILPLDLSQIVPDGMDIDSIEWYVQEHYDPTFKAAGGIILNKDETIGNVSVFKPSDGKIGITPEEQSKYRELEELGKQVRELIEQKKANAKRYREAQEAFLRYEEASDRQLNELQEKIEKMLDKEQDKANPTNTEQASIDNNEGEER